MKPKYTIFHAIYDFCRSKLKYATASLTEERRQHCQACEMRNKTLNTCTICGCYIPAKTRLEEASCPMDVW